MTLLPANSSLLELALDAAAAELIDRIAPPFPELMSAADTPAAFLPYLAADRGIGQWPSSAPEAQKRLAVAQAWEVKRLAGTRHAIKRALAAAGYDVLSIEGGAAYQRAWRDLAGRVLDASWRLDGTHVLSLPPGSEGILRGTPLDHWSKYAIHINTSGGAWSRDQQARIKELAEEHGPLRSELVAIVAALRTRTGRPLHAIRAAQSVRVRLQRCQRVQPLQRRTLDGCWSLGGETAPQLLDGTLVLDGTRRLNGLRLVSTWNWAEGHATPAQRLRLRLRATVGTGSAHSDILLGAEPAKLDGTLRLDTLTLQGWPLNEGVRLGDAQLDRINLRRLDGTWLLGPRPTATSVRARLTARIRQHGITTQVAL